MRRSPSSTEIAPITPAGGSVSIVSFEGHSAEREHAPLFAACRALRRSVFVEEQRVPESLEWDGLDACARHFLALDRAEDPSSALGTARLQRHGDSAKAERVAVRREARRRGVGRALMLALEDAARREGFGVLLLHAQVTAMPFYESLGYTARGGIFLEAGIDHRAMTKRLS